MKKRLIEERDGKIYIDGELVDLDTDRPDFANMSEEEWQKCYRNLKQMEELAARLLNRAKRSTELRNKVNNNG